MKKNFNSAIKCLLMSICLAGVGSFMFASMGYADEASIISTESPIYDPDYPYYHESSGKSTDPAHGTTEWQELGSTDDRGSTFYDTHLYGTNDYGVSWSINGGDFCNDNFYVGDKIIVQVDTYSENIGNHYANVVKAWFAPDGYAFDESNKVVSGFKVIRDSDGGRASSGYTFDPGHDDPSRWWRYGDTLTDYRNNRDNKGYGNDTYTVLSEEIEITEEYLGTAYLSARVTCSDSLSQSLGYYDWNAQWGIATEDYLAAFDAYSYYYQGEIETWAITVKSGLSGGGVTPVPEPATLALFGMGLIGLARIGRKKI